MSEVSLSIGGKRAVWPFIATKQVQLRRSPAEPFAALVGDRCFASSVQRGAQVQLRFDGQHLRKRLGDISTDDLLVMSQIFPKTACNSMRLIVSGALIEGDRVCRQLEQVVEAAFDGVPCRRQAATIRKKRWLRRCPGTRGGEWPPAPTDNAWGSTWVGVETPSGVVEIAPVGAAMSTKDLKALIMHLG